MTVHAAEEEARAVAAALARASERYFSEPVVIENLRRLSGGASRQTWSFDALVQGAPVELILRRDPPSQSPPNMAKTEGGRSVSLDRATEYRVLRAAHRAGVRAPDGLFELTPAD